MQIDNLVPAGSLEDTGLGAYVMAVAAMDELVSEALASGVGAALGDADPGPGGNVSDLLWIDPGAGLSPLVPVGTFWRFFDTPTAEPIPPRSGCLRNSWGNRESDT